MAVDLEEFERLLNAHFEDEDDEFGGGEVTDAMLELGCFIEGNGRSIIAELRKLRTDFADAMKILKPMAAYCEARHGFSGPVKDGTGVLHCGKNDVGVTVGHFRAAKAICDRQA